MHNKNNWNPLLISYEYLILLLIEFLLFRYIVFKNDLFFAKVVLIKKYFANMNELFKL